MVVGDAALVTITPLHGSVCARFRPLVMSLQTKPERRAGLARPPVWPSFRLRSRIVP